MSIVDRLFPRSRAADPPQPALGVQPAAMAAPPVPPPGPVPITPSSVSAQQVQPPVPPAPSPAVIPGPPAAGQPVTPAVGSNGGGAPLPPTKPGADLGALRARQAELSRQLADLQWDLGGLTYEMAIRDHFRLDVLIRMASRLQEVDAELAESERLLRLNEGGAAGECPSCRAPHSRGAVYCWSCGAQLIGFQQTAP